MTAAPAPVEIRGEPQAVEVAGPAVRLEHVTKSFGPRKVLDDVSFDVTEGSGFIILGRSGTGKSVTLRHMIGLVQPDSGKVFVRGEEISSLRGKELAAARMRMGFLFQNAALFDSISVGENVAFPLRRHTDLPDREIRERAMAKLQSVGLEREFEKMPADLSGGMKKRAGLARALALDPKVLLVDEPSAGLDPITTGEIDELLVRLKGHGGTTLIVVTHNIPSARSLGDDVVMLHEGRILARGTPAELDRSDEALVRTFMASKNAG
ncbi:MAG TPA: ABC transporter ATP-binding protein [Vicinamibacterales bacterium]|nr:ABC transporter ATP-binding protein [Vicinamibacterales bacterium]